MNNKIIEGVKEYYSEKIITHGPTSKGVDWNSSESQHERFVQLCKILNSDVPFSVLDYGCGYGEMYNFLNQKTEPSFNYTGYDISPEMLTQASQLLTNSQNVNLVSQLHQEHFDYVIASGIFNIRLQL